MRCGPKNKEESDPNPYTLSRTPQPGNTLGTNIKK